MKELRLALIGCGAHSESAHASTLSYIAAQNPGSIALTAACDINLERAERFCRDYGFQRAYTDMEAMLETEKPDGVISVPPVEQNAEIAEELLRRGLPCVIEKPPGRNIEEAQALAEVARQTGTPHMVSMNRRFHPYLNHALKWAKQQGSLRYLHGQMLRNARSEEEFLWGTGVHIVDAICALGGEVASAKLQKLGSSSAAWYVITLSFASGCIGTIEILPTAGYDDEVFELFGDDYRAVVHTMGRVGESVQCWKNNTLTDERIAASTHPLFLRNGSYEETTAFLDALRAGTPLYPTLNDVLPALRVCG